MAEPSRWQPGRLLLGWALGVLTTLGAMAIGGGWFEYRELSTAPGSGSAARRASPADSACQVDRDGAINVGGYRVVPGQTDPCYLYRPRVRPWQWYDGLRDQLSRLTGTISSQPVPSSQAGAAMSAYPTPDDGPERARRSSAPRRRSPPRYCWAWT
jgi:hypothetical protein